MTEPDEFDQFYKDVRTRLLLLTYCLTGDLPSSRAAVRDAFVVAWHHWRKVTRVEDPESWVREHACRHAVRRHTTKIWHREKNLDAGVKATLDALGRLSMTQRRVLLVTELTSSSMAAMAREVGLPRTEAERVLQTATSTFSLHREIPTTDVRRALEAVREHVDGTSWPRPTIIRRAGATRRRTHTVIGVAATAAALVITGTLVTDADGVRPTLAGERIESKQPAARRSRRWSTCPRTRCSAPTPSPLWCPPAASGRSRAPTTTPPAPVRSRPARGPGTPHRTAARTVLWSESSLRSRPVRRPGPRSCRPPRRLATSG